MSDNHLGIIFGEQTRARRYHHLRRQLPIIAYQDLQAKAPKLASGRTTTWAASQEEARA